MIYSGYSQEPILGSEINQVKINKKEHDEIKENLQAMIEEFGEENIEVVPAELIVSNYSPCYVPDRLL